MKYNLFNINDYTIETSRFNHMLHGSVQEELEKKFAEYVGAKYAVTGNSASSLLSMALFGIYSAFPPQTEQLLLQYPLCLPSMIPVAVANLVHNSSMPATFIDEIDWVGGSYVLYDTAPIFSRLEEQIHQYAQETESQIDEVIFKPFKVIDSAQEVRKNQYKEDSTGENDLMVFSFYPTKPVGGMDGGILCTNNEQAAKNIRTAINLGYAQQEEGPSNREGHWEKELVFPGWKSHANSAQCHVALKNLEKLDEKNAKLDKIREKYNDAFNLSNKSRHLYRINVMDRDNFMMKLKTFDIQTGIHYKPTHNYDFYRLIKPNNMNRTNECSKVTMSIPFNESLSTEDVDFIIKKIKDSGNLLGQRSQ